MTEKENEYPPYEMYVDHDGYIIITQEKLPDLKKQYLLLHPGQIESFIENLRKHKNESFLVD